MPELLAHYPFTDTAYHELLDRQGGVRPHWQRLFRQLERSSPEQLRQRQALVERQIQENGVTYNVYADPKGTDRPWALDLLPNLLSAAEWQPIAAGVAQRARLLNALLADLYGDQRLLAEGLLPSELVFGHPNFLWPALGIRPPGGIFLHSYAVDLARDADGRWQVLADRTQAPSGAGYALENRQIVSRALPELYRDLRVQHLAGYFRTLQEELRTDSALGIPGLLEAVRQGRVLVANALGSGVLESPGLLGFLPQACRRLLGEELALPSLDTRWCGEPQALEAILAALPDLVIKPAFPGQRCEPLFGHALDSAGLASLGERLRERPQAYVAQRLAQLSQAPVWRDGEAGVGLQSRAIGMRVFAVAAADGRYWVMPGGLTRVASAADAEVVSMQRGGASKDTWVLAERAVGGEPWRPRRLGVRDLVREDPYLPSRVVENLFWYGRYAERCDDHARLLRVVLSRYVDADGDEEALRSALALAGGIGLLPGDGEPLERCLLRALLDEHWPASLCANLRRLHWAAAQVRGRLSGENWLALLELQRDMQALDPARTDLGEALDFLNRLVMSLAALSGFALDDMTRDDGWRFLMIGRRIERVRFFAESIAAFLDGGSAWDAGALEWLLELGNSGITYRSRYLASPQLVPVLDLLLLHEQNPHSLRFQLQALERSLERLHEEFGAPRERELRTLGERLRSFDLAALESPLFGAAGLDEVLVGLARLLRDIAACAGQVSDRLGLRYFAHVDDVSQRTVST
ncbi:circularly permuted type 2 ATP-grasp protein [Pseudomonas aeruginosa]|uniref:circularly permuted type 2 ATP-grasp protein n=1 Tax=Pseudomonas aeruginosa TaxID=287 RepID=UPI00104D70B1|nr:circularly permuted type 2 ATP-grasp protein [Pseudomonas aeruginosa]